MAGGFHVTSPESPTYQPALTKSPSLSNLEFFFWLIRLFPTCGTFKDCIHFELCSLETEEELIIEMCQTRSLGCPQCCEDIGSHVGKTCDTKIQSIVKI